jgi:hypothetical protein
MRKLLYALQKLELEISAKKGPLTLFGVFRRESSVRTWDLILSAPWMDDHDLPYLRRFAKMLAGEVGSAGMSMLSRLDGLHTKDPFVVAVRRVIPPLKHGCAMLQKGEYGGVEFSMGFVITSKPVKVRRPISV